jgi:hypothetical protein
MYDLERLIHHQLFRQANKHIRSGISHSVVAIVLISGIITSCGGPPPNLVSNTPQNVIIFLGGMNTSIDNQCHEGTFDQLITAYLVKEIGVANPYLNGCNAQSQSYLNSPSSIAFFSYKQGQMDEEHGVWMPHTYGPCDVNNQSLSDDINDLSDMLTAYQKVFPRATFTLVGHSLGGLVALQGAYNFAITQHHSGIAKVITLDSPLEGIFVTQQATNLSLLSGPACKLGTGTVIYNDLAPLGKVSFVSPLCVPNQGYPTIQSPVVISQCAARALATTGVGVDTLGNDKDNLFCQPGWVILIGQSTEKACDTQVLLSEVSQFWHMYSYSTPYSNPNPSDIDKIAHDHGTLLVTPAVEQDLTRFILAPVISVSQPAPNSIAWFNGNGTPLHFSASVHCLWGQVNHAEAVIQFADKTTLSAGTFKPNYSGYTLNITGTTTLLPSVQGDTATFYVKAGEDACGYPHTVNSNSLPTDSDYLYGATRGVTFSLDGGKIAMGFNSRLYAGRVNESFLNNPLAYPAPSNVINSITDVSWSPDGTHLAYLVTTGSDQNGTFADLYKATSKLTGEAILSPHLSDAVALTWNSSGDAIAVLEEHQIAQLPAVNYQPSIVIIDASKGILKEEIQLPPSVNQSDLFCELTCYAGRARIQWGRNGLFLIGYGATGGTLVTAPLQTASVMGQATELETIPTNAFIGPDMAPIGALDQQGTHVAFPIENFSTGKFDINLYTIGPSSVKLGAPTLLNTFIQPGLGVKVDFSPDGTKLGVCADKGVYVIDIQNPGTMQTVLALPGQAGASNGTAPSLPCDNLRWSPHGQSLLVQLFVSGITEYGFTGGWTIISLNGSPPQVIYGCGITATNTGLLISGGYSPNCQAEGGGAFEWQPEHVSTDS